MNTQPRHPKCRALPVEPHPDIQFLPLYHGREENQRFFCLWSFMWSKPLLCRFRQPWKIPQTQVSQGFAAFRLALSRIPPRHSQTRRDTSFAIPGCAVHPVKNTDRCVAGNGNAHILSDFRPACKSKMVNSAVRPASAAETAGISPAPAGRHCRRD